MLADGFSWGECASFFEIMADGTTSTVRKDFIEYWFRELALRKVNNQHTDTRFAGNERLPTDIGWTRRPTVMKTSERTRFTRKLMEAAGEA